MLYNNSKIYVAGHNGMVGSSVLRLLKLKGFNNLIFKSSNELDLRNQKLVYHFFKKENPEFVINAAAKVGGILANDTYPYEFLMDNLLIQNNLIKSALDSGVKNSFLGSSCIYPKFANQPIKEEYLLNGYLEPTNEWYAIAKISGLKLCQSIKKQFGKEFISLMPTNLYGPNDNFDLNSSHVIPALIRKIHEAKKRNSDNVELWGTGNPKREFLHTDDLANAILFALKNKINHDFLNVGSGIEISITNLAELIKNIIGYDGTIIWDKSKPDGTPRKLIDSTKINKLGWFSKIELKNGIKETYKWYLNSYNDE